MVKKILAILIMLFVPALVMALQPGGLTHTSDDLENTPLGPKEETQDEAGRTPWSDKCPMGPFYHLDVSDCMRCHTEDMRLKEVEWDADLDYPHSYMEIVNTENGQIGEIALHGGIQDASFTTGVEYFYEHGIRYVVIDIMSPGGGMFAGWRIIATMDRYRQKGMTFEAQVDGFAASAAFLVFIGADVRTVTPYSFLMWHEVWTFKMFDVSTPSSKEEEARVLRKFQDNLNGYIAAHTQLTKDQVDDLVKKKEMWLTGEEALERGIATKLIEDTGLVMDE